MTLAARQLRAAVADDGVEARRQLLNKRAASCCNGRFPDLVVGRLGASVAYVLHQRTIEKGGVLRHDGDGLPEARLSDAGNILPVDQNAAALQIVETLQERDEGGFAAARRTDEPNSLALFQPKAEIVENLRPSG